MAAETRNSRARILEAAAELAREVGPGNISLDSVAQRAGLSKGGLLYNFPSKAKLMEALVEMHISRNREALGAACRHHETEPNALARAIVEVFRGECREKGPPASGVLAAIAENPHFLDPIRENQRHLVARLKLESDDAELACLVFLMVEGLRCLRLFDIDAFTDEEADRLMDRMAELVLTAAAKSEPFRAS